MILPEAFLAALPIPQNEVSDFVESLALDTPVSVRFNPMKALPNQNFQPVPWCDHAYYLPTRPRFTSDPAFHAGAYYPQEASSMFLGTLIKSLGLDQRPIAALDLCAAPGGKSNLLRTALHPQSFLLANETIGSRTKILNETLLKWGISGYAITQKDPSVLGRLEGMFDLILVDAPCSGEGLFRKNPDAIKEWSPNLVNLCSSRQKRILSDIWPALKPGGILIYSTCTYNQQENEANLEWLSKEKNAQALPIEIPSLTGLIITFRSGISGYRFMPHKITGEGFFIAAVQKLDEKSQRQKKVSHPQLKPYKSKLLDANRFHASDQPGNVFALLEDHLPSLGGILAAGIKLYQPGMPLGRDRAGQFKPDHGYAMQASAQKMLPVIEVELEQALHYLSRADLAIDTNSNATLSLMRHAGFDLGLGKLRNGRITSEYPIHWRILHAQESLYQPLSLAVESLTPEKGS